MATKPTKKAIKTPAKAAAKPAVAAKKPAKPVAKASSKKVSKPEAKKAVKIETKKPAVKAPAKKEIKPVAKTTEKKAVSPAIKEIEKPVLTHKKEFVEVSEPVKKGHAKKETSHDEDDLIEISIEKKLTALYSLQQIDTEINKIRIVRGELPLEVQDLEDELAGLETRINNYKNEVEQLELSVKEKKNAIKDCNTLIKKYETQQNNVRNNREYDAISKEIEFQNLEIQLCEKRIKEFNTTVESKMLAIDQAKKFFKERQEDLKQKKLELEEIVAETEKEELKLMKKFQDNQKYIEERLLTAYQRIKKNARNGLAVVMVERDACGGCFNKIPPQRQLDIKMHKKIIVCEYCGRILVDKSIEEISSKN
jgi:uncharacterized protein